MYNVLPSDLRKLFTVNDEIQTYHTRQVFHVPDADTSMYGINSLKFHSIPGKTVLPVMKTMSLDLKVCVIFCSLKEC